jgi:hypothetical protein
MTTSPSTGAISPHHAAVNADGRRFDDLAPLATGHKSSTYAGLGMIVRHRQPHAQLSAINGYDDTTITSWRA